MSEVEFNEIEPKIIKTVDENGEVHNFELIDIINIDEKEYGLLVYLSDEKKPEAESEEEEEEVLIMKLSKEDDAYTFETIEDDEEFNMVLEYLENEEEDEEE